MLDLHVGSTATREVLPPFLANAESLIGTGQLPKFEEDLFKLDATGYYLIPTAEVPLTNLHRDEILAAADAAAPLHRVHALLPRGGRRGGQRHARPDPPAPVRQGRAGEVRRAPRHPADALETLTADAEAVLRRLELPYRVVTLCTGDIGFAAAKTYDLEVWLPGQDAYQEISSCSNFEDFQARRASIRYRRAEGEKPRVRPHAERLGPGGRPDARRDPRELPASRRLGRDPGGAPALHGRPDRDPPGRLTVRAPAPRLRRGPRGGTPAAGLPAPPRARPLAGPRRDRRGARARRLHGPRNALPRRRLQAAEAPRAAAAAEVPIDPDVDLMRPLPYADRASISSSSARSPSTCPTEIPRRRRDRPHPRAGRLPDSLDAERRAAAFALALLLLRDPQADPPPDGWDLAARRPVRVPHQPDRLSAAPHAALPGRPLDRAARRHALQVEACVALRCSIPSSGSRRGSRPRAAAPGEIHARGEEDLFRWMIASRRCSRASSSC